MSCLHDVGVPDAVEICIAPEEADFVAVSAEVCGMSHVEGLMHVAYYVDYDFHGELSVGKRSLGIGKGLDLSFDGRCHIAGRIGRGFLVAHTLVNILIMPSLCVGILWGVACVVEPVGPVDHRLSFED